LFESDIHIGDIVAAGTARLRVTQPRMPCVKLAIRFGRPDMVKLFWNSNRSGVYFAVDQAGDVGAGDEIRIVEAHPLKVSVADVVSLYKGETSDSNLFERVIASPLSGSWKEDIREQWAAV
jgi:MOSC domain-containing protein YiiM